MVILTRNITLIPTTFRIPIAMITKDFILDVNCFSVDYGA